MKRIKIITKPSQAYTRQIYIRMNAETYEKLESIAALEGVTKTAVARSFLDYSIQKYEQQNNNK
jgi:hypothetical protein